MYRKNRTNRSNPNRIDLVWFGSVFIFKVNQTKPHSFLSRGSDDFYTQN